MIEYTIQLFNDEDWNTIYRTPDPRDIAVQLAEMRRHASTDFSKAKVLIATIANQKLIPAINMEVTAEIFLAGCGITVTFSDEDDDREQYYDPDDDDSPWHLDPNVSGD